VRFQITRNRPVRLEYPSLQTVRNFGRAFEVGCVHHLRIPARYPAIPVARILMRDHFSPTSLFIASVKMLDRRTLPSSRRILLVGGKVEGLLSPAAFQQTRPTQHFTAFFLPPSTFDSSFPGSLPKGEARRRTGKDENRCFPIA